MDVLKGILIIFRQIIWKRIIIIYKSIYIYYIKKELERIYISIQTKNYLLRSIFINYKIKWIRDNNELINPLIIEIFYFLFKEICRKNFKSEEI